MKALRSDGRWLRDRLGRVVLLRGVNAGGDAKLPPFLPLAREECADQIAGWGMNAVRLATVWEAIEPSPGEIDHAYLDRLAECARWLTSRGVYVFVDMHQDLFARRFNGDGAPAWAAAGDPAELLKPPGLEWFLNYISPPVVASFGRFWTDASLQDHFLDALGAVAARFRDDDRVIGYDVWNEPWHGEIDLPSGRFEREALAPFYRRAMDRVRAHDPDALLFVEPAVLAAGLLTMQSRLPPIGPGVVYAPHYYAVLAMMGVELEPGRVAGDLAKNLALVREKADELGGPALLGEFGAFPMQEDAAEIVSTFFDGLDDALMGGTIWEYALRDREWNDETMSLVDAELGERATAIAAARPYPAAIAGVPRRVRWDASARRLEVEIDRTDAVDAPTEIRIPRSMVAAGAPIVRVTGGAVEWNAVTHSVIHVADPRMERHTIVVELR